MLSKKVIIPSLALVSLGNAIVQEQATDLSNCRGSFSEQVSFLYMNCYDGQGNLVERYQRLFTRPLEKEQREVPRSSLNVPSGNASVLPTPPSNNSTSGNETSGNSTSGNSTSGNSTAGNSSSSGNETSTNVTTPVVNETTPVVNETLPVVNETAPVEGGRRLQEVVDNGTVVENGTVVDNTTNVDNTTTIDNSTSVDNTTAPVDNSTAPVNGTNSTDNGTSSGNGTDGGVTTAVQVNCVDYYERGAGYEFSVCDMGIGAIIIPERIGSDRDRFWASQPSSNYLGPIWTDLGNLVDNYCDARQNQTQSQNSTQQVDGAALWRSLDLPWDEWRNDALNSFADVGVWLSRYTQYVGQAQNYLNNNPGATLPASANDYNPTNVDLSSVSYGQLVTEYRNVYSSFIEWYNLFFGVDGLVAVNQREVMDGSVPVWEFSGNITSFEGGEGAATFAVENPFDLQYQLSAIGEWISTKFGGVILANSCNLCNSQTVVPPVNNGTENNGTAGNNTTPVDNSSNSTNGTAPVDNGTVVDNGTTVDNGTVVDNTTVVDNSSTVDNSSVVEGDGTTVVDQPTGETGETVTPGPQP